MGTRQYIGARYVPIFDGNWDITKDYEPLVIVSNAGNSYTSRTFIPAGIDISNTTYWALTGNYNAQVEAYRQDVANLSNDVNDLSNNVNALLNGYVTVTSYGATGDGVTDDSAAFNDAFNSGFTVIVPSGDYNVKSGVEITKPAVIIFEPDVTITVDTDAFVKSHNVDHIYLYGNGTIITGSKNIAYNSAFTFYNGEDFVIDGFTIIDSSTDGIYLNSANRARVNNVEIVSAARNGISVITSDDFVISNTHIDQINTNNPKACIDIEPNAGDDTTYVINGIFENILCTNSDYGIHADIMFEPSEPISITVNGLTCKDLITDVSCYLKKDKNITGLMKVDNYTSFNAKNCPVMLCDIIKSDNFRFVIDGDLYNPNSVPHASIEYTKALIDVLNYADYDMGYIDANLRLIAADSNNTKYSLSYRDSVNGSNKELNMNINVETDISLNTYIQQNPKIIGKIELPAIKASYSITSGIFCGDKLIVTPASTANVEINRFINIGTPITIYNLGAGSCNIKNSAGKIYPIDTVGDTYVNIGVGKSVTLERLSGTADFICTGGTINF